MNKDKRVITTLERIEAIIELTSQEEEEVDPRQLRLWPEK